MAQNVTIAGASYSDVPAITVPKTGGGTADFTDVSDTTATPQTVGNGIVFYNSAGVRSVGIKESSMDLLWENPDPTSSFAAQTVSIDLSSYDSILIFFRMATTTTYGDYSTSVIGSGETNFSAIGDLSAAAIPMIRQRHYTPTSTGVTFGSSYQKVATDGAAPSVNNTVSIPYRIWGIKYAHGSSSDGAVKVGSITISSSSWTAVTGAWTQTVTISGATILADTKVDLQPDATAIAQMTSDGVTAMYVSNTNGTLTLYSVGSTLTSTTTVQCTYYKTV